ncbi:MAG: ATP--guanido phosphotransferase [Clostridia bacterium]|nr:ATP--guanido phosphotransferase [Clostridia bacterium]
MKDMMNKIVVSSRIRLARNIADLPFPHKLEGEQAFGFMKKISDLLQESGNFKAYLMSQMSDVQKRAFVEKHLISLDLTKKNKHGAVIVSDDESISVMLNEEDHIREQSIVKGFDLALAFEKIKKVDQKIIANVPLAYDDTLGFLTSCPTNVGTGMRASVMMFLPSLTKTGKINSLIKALDQKRMTVRGIYGEGSESEGYLYQVSNKISLGFSEEDIIANVSRAVEQICNLEMAESKAIFESNKIAITDKIMRSKGILTNAYVLSTKEFFERFADVKLGVTLGILNCKDVSKLDDFLVGVLPANLMLNRGSAMNETERDLFRASYTRENLNKILN